jgi:hypothetical protein
MADIILGILAIIAGCAMLVAGQLVLRLVIPIWGFVAGFAFGAGIVAALGFSWSWVAVLVGLALGIILGLVSLFANVPMIVLVIVGSIAGAVGVTGGLMLLVGALDSADFSRGDFTDTVSNSFGWSLLLFVLAIGGIVIQAMQRAVMRQSIQETWYAESR